MTGAWACHTLDYTSNYSNRIKTFILHPDCNFDNVATDVLMLIATQNLVIHFNPA